jgi:aspartate/methionine/tyrosine aminotransferase
MRWRRMPMEAESPEEYGYDRIRSNLAESSCRDRTFADLGVRLDDLVLLYGDHRGLPPLRALLAAEAGLPPEAVLTTAGAAMALFLVHVALLGPDTHLVVTSPNYATNLETPFAIGGPVTEVPLSFEESWQVDPDRIAAAMRPDTRLVSVTTPHNPTGTEMPLGVLRALVDLVEKRGAFLLVDETYRDMAGTLLPVAASLSPRVITVSSVSKTYGVPGIREGWLVCGDRALVDRMLAAKEQIVLTGSVVDEALALEVLSRRDALLPAVRAHIARQRAAVAEWVASEPRVAWVPPTGGVVAFPRLDPGVDTAAFYRRLLDAGVFVGPGHWFGQPPRHFRLGWGWPTPEELSLGLAAISAALADRP